MRIRSVVGIASAALLIAAARPASAMPMFARKLGVPCATCHTTIPRLNEVGFRFREAGFRLPDDIGKAEKEFKLEENFSGRIQGRYDASRTKTGPRLQSSQPDPVS